MTLEELVAHILIPLIVDISLSNNSRFCKIFVTISKSNKGTLVIISNDFVDAESYSCPILPARPIKVAMNLHSSRKQNSSLHKTLHKICFCCC